MERYEELSQKARKAIQLADHVLTMTYPLVKDPRLLLSVLENTFLAMTQAMSSVLYLEREYKRIPLFHDDFKSKLSMFKERIAPRHSISKDKIKLLEDIRNMLLAHKESPVEFVRKDRFVICSGNYSMKAISVEQLKSFVATAKSFVAETTRLINKRHIIAD